MTSSLNLVLTCTESEKNKLGKKRHLCALLAFAVVREGSGQDNLALRHQLELEA